MSATSLIIFYAICALIVALALLRLYRRKRRERQATADQLAARLNQELAHERRTDSAESNADAATTNPVQQPIEESQPEPIFKDRIYGQESSTRSTAGMHSRPLFDVLGKRQTAADIKLPHVEAAETPLATAEDYVFGSLTPILSTLLPDSDERRAQAKRELQTAGYYRPHAHQNLAAIRYVCIMAPLLLLGGLLLISPPAFEPFILGAIVIVPLMGWALPRLYVKSRGKERTNQIENALPDMLDMLNMCVSQGMTVPAALKRINQDLPKVHPALHKELQIVSEQAQIGTMEQSLQNFSRRIDVPEVHSFTSLLIQTERMGTSVSSALAEYSDNMRAGMKQRADEKGNRAAFKLLFPTVLCLMPAVFMFLLGPSVIEITKFAERDDQTLNRANDLIRRQDTLRQNSPFTNPQRRRR